MTQLLSPKKDSRSEVKVQAFRRPFLPGCPLGFTVERIKDLMEKAKRLEALNFTNICYKVGDGSVGWQEHAPFDRIMVTAAARVLPDELVNQLAPGGRMVIPVGPSYLQELSLITRTDDGDIHTKTICMVRFVELKGQYGWTE